MLGSIMQVNVSDTLIIRLAPFAREDLPAFIKDGGMQSHVVMKYLARSRAQSLESEQAWYDKVIDDPSKIVWGLWDVTDPTVHVLIGNSGLFDFRQEPMRSATSGSLIVRREYWGRGIASAAHKARTAYAFQQLNLDRVTSIVMEPNTASRRALEGSGYYVYGHERNYGFVDGQYVHAEFLECLNPSEEHWRRWWGADTPSQDALAARSKAQKTLEWANKNVQFI